MEISETSSGSVYQSQGAEDPGHAAPPRGCGDCSHPRPCPRLPRPCRASGAGAQGRRLPRERSDGGEGPPPSREGGVGMDLAEAVELGPSAAA